VGPQVSQNILTFIHQPSTHELYQKMCDVGLTFKTLKTEKTLTHMCCVLTGKLNILSRSAASEALVAKGAEVQSQVSSKTTHLIAGEKAGSKLTKAKSLGIKILTEEELMALLSI
jgi:DNA ligase (NAD+)